MCSKATRIHHKGSGKQSLCLIVLKKKKRAIEALSVVGRSSTRSLHVDNLHSSFHIVNPLINRETNMCPLEKGCGGSRVKIE